MAYLKVPYCSIREGTEGNYEKNSFMTSPEQNSDGLLLKRLTYRLLHSLKTFMYMIRDTHYSNLSTLKTFHLKTRRSFEWDNEVSQTVVGFPIRCI